MGRWRKKVECTLIWVKVTVVQLKAEVSEYNEKFYLPCYNGEGVKKKVLVLYEPEFESPLLQYL